MMRPREEFIIFNSSPVASCHICLRKCIDIGSSTQMDDFEVKTSLLDKPTNYYLSFTRFPTCYRTNKCLIFSSRKRAVATESIFYSFAHRHPFGLFKWSYSLFTLYSCFYSFSPWLAASSCALRLLSFPELGCEELGYDTVSCQFGHETHDTALTVNYYYRIVMMTHSTGTL